MTEPTLAASPRAEHGRPNSRSQSRCMRRLPGMFIRRRKGWRRNPTSITSWRLRHSLPMPLRGEDPDLVIAALLHDAIEDQEVPRQMIAEGFGEDVARLVEEVTDDMSLPGEERKRLQVEQAAKKSDRAKIIKLADKISNVRAISAGLGPDWSVKRRLNYVSWARDVVVGLRGINAQLEQEFDRVADDAEQSVKPKS